MILSQKLNDFSIKMMERNEKIPKIIKRHLLLHVKIQ
jgi:hypothetical protein